MGNLFEQSRAAMRAAVLLLAFWVPGVSLVAAEGATDAPAFVACKTAAAQVPALHLSDGHMHERYEFRIRGVRGIDVTDFQCSLKTDLPPGLKLDCGKLLIWGAPQGPVGTVTDEIRIFDGSGGEQCVNVDMKIVDKPDEGWIGGDPAGKPPAPAKKPAAAPAPAPAAAAPAKKPVANAAATPGTVTSRPELDVELTSPVVEGTSVITGTVTTAGDGKALDDTMVTGLAVQLRITKADGSRILAALTTSTPTAYQAAVNKGSFTLNLKTPLAAGDKGQLELVPDAEAGIFTLANKDRLPGFKDGLPEFAIGNDLHLPVIEVTSQLRDGVTTIEGTYRKVPSPAIASDPSATPPVVGNLPRVQVWLHDPDAPQHEWYQAALVQGTGSNQSTVSDVEAIKDGTFTATLKTALTPGQSVQIRLYPAKGHAFRTEKGLPQEYALWRGQEAGKPVYTSLAIAPPVITSVVEAGQGLISGTATPSTSGTKVIVAVVSDDNFDYTLDQGARQAGWTQAGSTTTEGTTTGPAASTSGTSAGASTPSGSATDMTAKEKDKAEKKAESKRGIEVQADALVDACLTQDKASTISGRFVQLKSPSGTGTVSYVSTDTTGAFSLTLVTQLIDGQRFHLVQIFPANTELTDKEKKLCKTTVSTARDTLDWGRIHADFVGGVLISNDSGNSTTGAAGSGSGNFSQAHQFYALSVEKTWALPGCYLAVPSHFLGDGPDGRAKAAKAGKASPANPDRTLIPAQCYDSDKRKLFPARVDQHFIPGFSTYFQARLTAIPVSTPSSTNTMTTAATGSSTASSTASPSAVRAQDTTGTGSTTSTSTTTAAASPSNFLSTAQTARVEVGAFLPFFVTRWRFDHKPYALFVAPLAKVGFDTVTGPSTINTISPAGQAQSQTFEQVYTYWNYGARIGHAELTNSSNHSPETLSYLDIGIGPYSSLQSYVCHGSNAASSLPTTSYCRQPGQTPFLISNAVDSRKRLYRFDIEGLLNIPKTPLYLGLNANIGQKTLGASGLDQGYAAPNDVRFLFGTKFDLASVLMKFLPK